MGLPREGKTCFSSFLVPKPRCRFEVIFLDVLEEKCGQRWAKQECAMKRRKTYHWTSRPPVEEWSRLGRLGRATSPLKMINACNWLHCTLDHHYHRYIIISIIIIIVQSAASSSPIRQSQLTACRFPWCVLFSICCDIQHYNRQWGPLIRLNKMLKLWLPTGMSDLSWSFCKMKSPLKK